MKREDVEALLDEALDAIGSFGYVDAEHLAALCRRWLAVEDAPAADIRENRGDSALLSAAMRAGYYQGQRVRIVPEQGEGGGRG